MTTRIHPETGKILRRDTRKIEFEYGGRKFTMAMPGWYAEDDDDAIVWQDVYWE